ncbi:MAG TPA: hypothetical protein VFO83_15050 [Aggregicoccus sp.]|nr:hypothetical protein [Aggregicoccus sp.]
MSAPHSIGGVLPIEVELRQEHAASLVRVSRRVEGLLGQVRQSEQQLQQLRGAARAAAHADHEQLRAEYEKHRWYLLVQREAMGLYHHDIIDELYPAAQPLR